jgi:hypothetical protein
VDIVFDFDPARDWEPFADTELNDMDRRGPRWPDRPNSIAARYPSKVVVFFRWGTGGNPTGNGNAYPPNIDDPIPSSWLAEPTNINFVTMPSTQRRIDQGAGFFAHELGDYLGLYHTFPFTSDRRILSLGSGQTLTAAQAEERIVRFIRSNGGMPGALNGDLLNDTSPDPGMQFLTCPHWLYHSLC